MQAQYSMQSHPMGLWLWSSSLRSTWFCWPLQTVAATSKSKRRSHLIVPLALAIFIELLMSFFLLLLVLIHSLFSRSLSLSFLSSSKQQIIQTIHHTFETTVRSDVCCCCRRWSLSIWQTLNRISNNEKGGKQHFYYQRQSEFRLSMSIVCYKRWSTTDILFPIKKYWIETKNQQLTLTI